MSSQTPTQNSPLRAIHRAIQRANNRARARWMRLPLEQRFAVAGGLVLALTAALMGQFLSAQIEQAVVNQTANSAAFYMESVLDPISHNITPEGQLSPNVSRALTEVFDNTDLGKRIVSYKIWGKDGLILQASDPAMIGRRFAVGGGLKAAWRGDIWASFDQHAEEEDAGERALGLPLLEIYAPIRLDWSGEIIAVAEFYEANPALAQTLGRARLKAWGVVAGVGLALGLTLFAIVRGGARTIEAQGGELRARLHDLRALTAHNKSLRQKVQQAAARAAARGEGQLRQISADLHDGPAQYLAYAALRLDGLRQTDSPPPDAAPDQTPAPAQSRDRDLDAVRDALGEAMREIRALSRGLALPELAGRSAAEVVRMSAQAHRELRLETVAVWIDPALEAPQDAPLPASSPLPGPSPALRICLYRFAQEGLTNAARHAGGAEMALRLERLPAPQSAPAPNAPENAPSLRLTVSSGGPHLGPITIGLGLSGLRDRVEALGGQFTLRPRATGGLDLIMDIGAAS